MLRGEVVQHCADVIDDYERRGQRIWFVPYTHFVRLNEYATGLVLRSSPSNPARFTEPPPDWAVEGIDDVSGPWHRHGAGAVILSRTAFEFVGGMDPRFAGWGGEDGAFVHAVSTLWTPYQTTPNDLLALWHPRTGHNFTDRIWANQPGPLANAHLSAAYLRAAGDPVMMRALRGVATPRGFWNRILSAIHPRQMTPTGK